MSTEFYIALIFFISIICFWITIVLKFSKKRKLTRERRKFFEKHLKQISIKLSSKEKIIDYDKLYHKILLDLWYQWTFWEVLRQYPSEISDIDWLRKLHKLRNKLVHDFDLLDEKILRKKVLEYRKHLDKLLKQH
jgi:hypothetical protein